MMIVTGIIPSNLFREELKGMSISCFNGKHYYDNTAKQALDNIERQERIDNKRARWQKVRDCEDKKYYDSLPPIVSKLVEANHLRVSQ
ncbi:hypothetical protein [uncultured Vagococcus sp.]|uniref:hypothetical protein n=1 Tax=uncultured Vagococcus sp. TaxID=189676 RepID=UPI0028D2FD3E|nr:hypothetical protein [uncultured Vagococcus sp.]